MDVNLLKRFDLAQDVNSLYKEVLRNCRNRSWYWQTTSGRWHSIDYLNMNATAKIFIKCETNNDKWVVSKWMYNS